MTDPNTPATPGGEQPSQQPVQPPAPPRYGEYAPPSAAPAQPAPDAAPAYTAPAYNAAPAYDPAAYGSAPGTPVPGKTLGIVAFILSFFVQLVALILGIVALVQSKRAGAKNGFAIAAIIISSVLIVLGLILLAIFLPLFIQSIDAATTCANDPTATVSIWGVDVQCSEIVDGSY